MTRVDVPFVGLGVKEKLTWFGRPSVPRLSPTSFAPVVTCTQRWNLAVLPAWTARRCGVARRVNDAGVALCTVAAGVVAASAAPAIATGVATAIAAVGPTSIMLRRPGSLKSKAFYPSRTCARGDRTTRTIEHHRIRRGSRIAAPTVDGDRRT